MIIVVVVLIMKNSQLKSENKFLKTGKREAENTLGIYFNQLLQYRDILIRNNLYQPEGVQQEQNGKKSTYTIDSILDEIAEKGIENISKDKLDFLKSKNNGKDQTNS